MGHYYYYANRSKQEWFCIDPTGQNIKSYALGANFGSRALSLLILGNAPELVWTHEMRGHWAYDEVAVLGDDYDSSVYEIQQSSAWQNIGPGVIEMMSVVDPESFTTSTEWLQRAIGSGDVSGVVQARLLEWVSSHSRMSPAERERLVDVLLSEP